MKKSVKLTKRTRIGIRTEPFSFGEGDTLQKKEKWCSTGQAQKHEENSLQIPKEKFATALE